MFDENYLYPIQNSLIRMGTVWVPRKWDSSIFGPKAMFGDSTHWTSSVVTSGFSTGIDR